MWVDLRVTSTYLSSGLKIKSKGTHQAEDFTAKLKYFLTCVGEAYTEMHELVSHSICTVNSIFSASTEHLHTDAHTLAIWNAADLSCDFKDRLNKCHQALHQMKELLSSPSSSWSSPSTPSMLHPNHDRSFVKLPKTWIVELNWFTTFSEKNNQYTNKQTE